MTGEIEHLVGEAPLVVVPSDELDKVAVQGDTGLCIEDRGVRIRTEVAGNDLIVDIFQNTLHRAFGSGLDGSADLFVGGSLLETDSQVNDRDVRSRDTHGHAGELAVQGRNYLANSLGSAGAGRNDVVVDGASAAKILLLREAVHDGLRSSGSVYGGHESLDDAEVIVNNLGQRSQAVSGAGSVGNELHVGGVFVKVDAADEHRSIVLCGTGHDDDLSTSIDVSLSLFLGQIHTSALQYILDAQLAPRDEGSVTIGLVREDLNDLAIDSDSAVLVVADDFAIEAAMDGIILHAISNVGSRMTGGVDGNDLDIVGLDGGAEGQRADAAETIDTNFNAH